MDRLIVGCGYLGRQVARLWLARGDRVFAATRGRAEELRALGVEPVVCDLMTGEGLERLPPARTVVHCVGFDRTAGATMRDVYVGGLRNVLERLPPPGRFVYVSSTGVYGQIEGEEVDETAPTEPAEESGRVILEAEQQLRSRLPGAVLLRFAGIYGPGRVLRRQAVAAGEPLASDPDRWLNLIHVEDGAAAILAADQPAAAGGVFNVADDHPTRRRAFYEELARLLRAPAPRFVRPDPFAGAPLPPHERANRRVSNRRLRTELGLSLRYPSFREGLPSCL